MSETEQVDDRKLSVKQRRFVDAYLGAAKGNGSKAAIIAGYSARQDGWRLLSNVVIRAAIDARMDEISMPRDEMLARLTEQARGFDGYVEAMTSRAAVVDVGKLIEDGKSHIIKSVKFSPQGQPIIEAYDAQAAMTLLAKLRGDLTEKHEHTGARGGPIAISHDVKGDALRALPADALGSLYGEAIGDSPPT